MLAKTETKSKFFVHTLNITIAQLIMIKKIRNIRQSLINRNQTGRYLKYALGEIVLVVIGILLALQINNKNEQRKT
jgi:hypothetical protein